MTYKEDELNHPQARLKMGHPCVLQFGKNGKHGIVRNCIVAGYKFTDYGKVLYDVRIFPYKGDEDESEQAQEINYLLRDIDSCAVFDPIELLNL